MIEFRTLGMAELEEKLGSGTRPIAVQAKRLALVAYLALAGSGRYRRRDSVVALFWPDLDEDHARGALRQALSYVRRTLDASAVVTRGEEEIALASEVVRCDAVQFDEAIAVEQLESAMALYRGDFLDGLFVSDASPELEQWIDAERTRLRQSAAACAWSLAERSRLRGDGVSAAAWGRRAASLVPDDEGKLRWLIALFDSIGDRAGAIEAYERFARRLETEYSAEPSAETKALMTAVRSRSVATAPPHLASLPAAPWSQPAPLPAAKTPSRRTLVLFAAATVLAIALGSVAYRRAEGSPRATIAVLPVEEMGTATTDSSYGDALTEQVITDLARFHELQVINRRTMMGFRNSSKRSRDIARQLDADAVASTALQRVGDSLRVTVQLTRAGEERVSWSWTASAANGDLFRLSERMADSIAAHAIGPRLNGNRVTHDLPRRVDPAALDLYIRGRYWWNKRGPGLMRAIGIFDAALDHDEKFALAYSGKGDAYVQLGYASLLRPDDAFPKARAAAERALALDSTLAEPHATLGFVKMYYEWDWDGADREFKLALALSPSYATAHEWYGLFLTAMGRFDEARQHEQRAREIDGGSVPVAATAAWVDYYSGKPIDAERNLKVVLREDSTFALARLYLGRVYQTLGKPDSALAAFNATGPLRAWVPTIAAEGHIHGTQGRRREALATLAQMDSLSRTSYVTAYGRALVHASLGQRDSAFAWLDSGVVERTHWMVWLRRDARWSSIRDDERFERIVRAMKLPR